MYQCFKLFLAHLETSLVDRFALIHIHFIFWYDVLYVATLTRLLSSCWKIDPTNFNVILCRLRIVFVWNYLNIGWFFLSTFSIDYTTNFIIDLFDNIMSASILIFRSLNVNSYLFYFLASSINNLFVLYISFLFTYLLWCTCQIGSSTVIQIFFFVNYEFLLMYLYVF